MMFLAIHFEYENVMSLIGCEIYDNNISHPVQNSKVASFRKNYSSANITNSSKYQIQLTSNITVVTTNISIHYQRGY